MGLLEVSSAPPAAGTYAPAAKPYKTGWYYGPALVNPTSVSPSINNTFYVPLWVPYAQSFDRIGINIVSAGAAGAKIKLGAFSHDNSTGLPGARLYATALLPSDAGAFVEEVCALTLSAGLYWLASCSSVSACNVAMATNVSVPEIGTATPAVINNAGYFESSVSIPATAAPTTTDRAPKVMLRAA